MSQDPGRSNKIGAERGTLQVSDRWGEPDPDLRLLVGLANKIEVEVPMRLFVPSGVLSGVLISMPNFFKQLSELLSASRPDAKDPIAAALAVSYEKIAAQRREHLQGNDADTDVSHIHLGQAVLHGTGGTPLTVGLWRGRLTAVNGWSMGSYGDPVD